MYRSSLLCRLHEVFISFSWSMSTRLHDSKTIGHLLGEVLGFCVFFVYIKQINKLRTFRVLEYLLYRYLGQENWLGREHSSQLE
jgi:hypothetical protein